MICLVTPPQYLALAITAAERASYEKRGMIILPTPAAAQPKAPVVTHAARREKHLAVGRAWLACGRPWGSLKRLSAEAGVNPTVVLKHMKLAGIATRP